jgi:preprotein translocase subunit SecE
LVNEQKKTATRQAAAQQAGSDFVRGVFTELRRVTWPTRNEWVSATILTLLLVIGVGLYTAGLDWGFGWVIDQLHVHNI